ncbi:hypothetical protein HO173_011259 [Letharia columbiana]|uniref:Uncharacterized protein n=1 Tax=Letharia columbiana TaxID=112416 RepID=A0A8H6KZD7_9LECA|nr:uncharacterized protein HO173_011259 [Letharia columbiana]KAF6229829.1 hypothetical protein HO173_011259 [Letharia columbiana]
MNDHASSSRSPPKTSTDADRSSDESASVSLEQELAAWGNGYQAWVDRNLQSLLKDFVTGKKSKIGVAMCPNTVTRCIAKEGTDEDLRFILGKIYQTYGPIRMYYKGCDTLANHWVTGWEVSLQYFNTLAEILFDERALHRQ